MEETITNAEWEILKVVWANKEVTSSFVSEILCEKMNWKKATVKTLLNRMLEKNILQKRNSLNKYIYYTKLEEIKTTEKNAVQIITRVCSKKVGEVLENIIDEVEISKDDIDKIIKKLKEKKKNAPEEIKCNCVKGQCNCGRS